VTSKVTLTRIIIAVTVAALSGCAGPDATGPEQAAAGFARALSASDGTRACSLLSPEVSAEEADSAGTSCAQAVLNEDLPAPSPVTDARIYGHQAWVRTGTDTVFLSEFPDGWRIIGAGCTPQGAKPYHCAISGG
jgi:hypothetical protein